MVIGVRQTKSAVGPVMMVWVTVMIAMPLHAQAPGKSTDPAAERRQATIIGGTQSPAPTLERCVDVEIGHENAFGCLNQKLKREVERANPSLNLPPIDARSSDVRVGNANEAALRQQYGANYGRSVYPFRPPTPTYALPRR